MITEYQEKLEAAFPVQKDVGIRRAVSEGMLLADGLVTDTPLLNTPVGRDLRGMIRRAGIMWRIHELSLQGDVEYETEMVPMQRGRWHCLEIRSGKFKAHVCRTEEAHAFPEESLTRNDERAINPQLDFFQDPRVVPLRPVVNDGASYAYLTFGVGEKSQLAHMCWGIESKDGGDWIAFVDALKRLSEYEEAIVSGTVEVPQKASKVRFHDFIQDALKKGDLEESSE